MSRSDFEFEMREVGFDTLLIATSNPDKVNELGAMLRGLPCRLIGLTDLPRALPPVEETGATFTENALLKAEHYHTLTRIVALADDSGLAVDALGGAPGVLSARYGGPGATSAEQIAKLLAEMRDVPEEARTARFICSLALVGDGFRQTFEGRCEGIITRAPRGTGGFGYDPIFFDPELGSTFAELTREEKAARSHRGRALAAARDFITRCVPRPGD
jgi:XTP/dITP diphosphohydrolase